MMPCTVTGSLEGDRELAAVEARIVASETTRMLCELCEKLEKSKQFTKHASEPLAKWWEAHKELDRIRNAPKVLCAVHPKYTASAKPRASCEACWAAWLKRK